MKKDKIERVYDYYDDGGTFLYQFVRIGRGDGKRCWYRREGSDGKWIDNLDGVERTLFDLPAVINAAKVWITEGELCADRVKTEVAKHRDRRVQEIVPTTSGGSTTWDDKFADYLKDKIAVIFADNDAPGRRYAETVAASIQRHAASIKVIELPGLREHGDIDDYLNEHSIDDVLALVEAAPELKQEQAAKESQQEPEQKKPHGKMTQADLLISLAEDVEFWHTPDSDGFAAIPVDDHTEQWPVRSRRFRQWLLRRYYKQTGGHPNNQALVEAVGVLEGRANFDGEEHPVFVRLAEHEGCIYLDLGNRAWEAVKISVDGWEVCASIPVHFRRPRGMLALPSPARGGSISELRAFLNLSKPNGDTQPSDDWVLLLSWLLAAMRPNGPFPIIVLHGNHGTAKSTAATVLRRCFDPAIPYLRGEPHDLRDLMIAASNSWFLAFDNLGYVQPWLSDGFCRLSTGGGFATRELYSDSDEKLFDAERPVLLNGIEEIVTKGDLLDRSLILYLPFIDADNRRAEDKFWAEFEQKQPRILGALLSILAAGLARRPSVRLDKLPRMADFALWASSCEQACGWPAGTFIAAYNRNREAANALALDASLLAAPVMALAKELGGLPWEGTATDLLRKLGTFVDSKTLDQKEWPKRGDSLSNHLRRLVANLRASGVVIEFRREAGSGRRLIAISNSENGPEKASQGVTASQRAAKAPQAVDSNSATSVTPRDTFDFEASQDVTPQAADYKGKSAGV